MAEIPFNPLDKRNLGESVAGALLKRKVGPLPPGTKFLGAGIYAIYYVGNLEIYRPIAESNRDDKFDLPIYVGKAVPPGARQGGFGLSTAPGTALLKRLKEHHKSVLSAENLQSEDFYCRYLVSDDIWIPLGEALLIEWFKPLWNVLITGFGNHPTGKRRETQFRSRWDTVHPGRNWAAKLPPNPQKDTELVKMIEDFYAGKAVRVLSPEEAVTAEESETPVTDDEKA